MKNRVSTILIVLLMLAFVLPIQIYAAEENTLKIVQQPESVSAPAGERISTGLVAEGEGLRYQWYLANVDMNDYSKSSLTGNEYYVTMKGKIHNRQVYCVVTDKYGNSVQSDTVTLTMTVENDTFEVLMHPYADPVKAGEQVRAEFLVEGEDLQYRWYLENVNMNRYERSSLTGNTYYVTMKPHIHNRRVYCIATDRYGRSVRSDVAELTMDIPDSDPLELLQPLTDVSAKEGTQVRVGALARGEGLRYQWYVRNADMQDYGKSSLTGPNYYVTMKPHIHNRQVYCLITDANGRQLRTPAVTLTMQAADNTHVHSFFEDAIPASCMHDGFVSFFCECGENYVTVAAGTKLPHEFSEYMDNMDATCTQNGTETAWCSCGASRTREKENSMLEHSFWWYQDNEDATCAQDGTETAKCEYCEATDTRVIEGSKLPHSFTQYHNDNNATCTADGTETAKCDHCDATDTRVVVGSKRPHSFTVYKNDNNATCTADGTETAKCDHCDATDSRVVPGTKLPHNYVGGTCQGCGHTPVGVKITGQPKNTTVVAGLSGSVTVTATGDGLTYEWYYKDTNSDTFVRATATGKTYTITMTNIADGRQAYCIVRDKYGNSVQTNTITFTKKETSSGDGATGEDGDIFIPFQ